MQIYANLFKINEKCYFSVSWPILILFVLSDRAWCGFQNFYTEFWYSLIMQIYANLFKINENATSPLFRNHNRSALEAGTYITHRVIYYPLVLFFLRSKWYNFVLFYVNNYLKLEMKMLNLNDYYINLQSEQMLKNWSKSSNRKILCFSCIYGMRSTVYYEYMYYWHDWFKGIV